MRKAVLVFVMLITVREIYSQRFGGNPPSVKWRQVNTQAAKVIFPKGMDSIAKLVAATVQHLELTTAPSIGPRLQKVSIVLQQGTTIPNAYVGLGPFRSEFNLTPPQNSFTLGSLPWHQQLAIHEFRHVQQYNNFNVGLSRVLRILFGQEGQALANSLVVPDWFYEGDAVYNETNVSQQGRGRLPNFFNDYRALWADGKNYSWMKLRNGSLRDFVPDHYRLGYLLVGYGRQKFGDEIWKKVTHDAAAYKGLLYPLQRAVKRNTGVNYQVFRSEALRFFQSQTGLEPRQKTTNERVPLHFVADEEYPAFINDSSLVFIKSSYRQVPSFVIRKGASELKLRVSDVSLDKYFSYRNGRIVYSSFRPDLRWAWKDYSDLNILDVQTGKQRRITTRSKYFSPDISEDGKTIVAVKVDPGGESALHLLDAATGKLVAAEPNPAKLFYTYPKFLSNSNVVTAVRDTLGLMSMALVNLASHTTEYLTPFSFHVLGFPFVFNDTLYFTAAHNHLDRLVAYSFQTKKMFRLVTKNGKDITGYYQPAVSSNRIALSHFTSSGYRLEQLNKTQADWENISNEEFAEKPSEFGLSVINNNPAAQFSDPGKMIVTRYSKSYRLVNFHSLQPLVNDPVYSFSLVGENVLNTLQSELFFSYNRNEQYKQAGFNAVYGGLLPYISGGVNYTMDRRGLYRNQRIYWDEWELRGGMNLPLNLSKGRLFTRLNVGSDLVYNQPNFKGVFKDSVGNQSFGYFNNFLSFSNQVQQARQHIYPRFAQSLLVNYKKAVSNFHSQQFLANGYLYLPGIFVNHSLILNLAYQQKDTLNQRSFSNNFPFSRGYSSENFYRMKKAGVNYHFPLCYPDAGFGNIIYLLRLRSNLFYDYTVLRDSRLSSATFRSMGTEVFFDTKWWNQLPLSLGFRYSYLLDRDLFGARGSNRFEFVLPVNILQR